MPAGDADGSAHACHQPRRGAGARPAHGDRRCCAPDWEASALLDLPVGESRSAFPARDALITHAASGLDAARDMALALVIARGERTLTTDSFRWREMVSAHARLSRTTGIHQLTAVEEEVITERGLSRFSKGQL